MRATAVLKEKGISVQHMHVSTLKPFTDPTIVEAIKGRQIAALLPSKTIWISAVLGSAVAGCYRGERTGQASGQDRPAGLSARCIPNVPDEEVRH